MPGRSYRHIGPEMAAASVTHSSDNHPNSRPASHIVPTNKTRSKPGTLHAPRPAPSTYCFAGLLDEPGDCGRGGIVVNSRLEAGQAGSRGGTWRQACTAFGTGLHHPASLRAPHTLLHLPSPCLASPRCSAHPRLTVCLVSTASHLAFVHLYFLFGL